MNPLMQRLFNSVRDGLFIVSPQGVTRYANQAALRLIPCRIGAVLPNEPLQRLIAGTTAGHLQLPHQSRIELGADCLEAGADTIRAELLYSPVGTDYIVLLKNITAEQFFKTGVNNLGKLIERMHREALADWGERIGLQLTRIGHAEGEDAIATRAPMAGLVAEGQALLASIQKLAQLAELAGVESVTGEDRIDLARAVLTAGEHLKARALQRSMRIVVEKPQTDLPPVYGSAEWIGRVAEELLENAIKHGRIGSDVTASLRQNASFVLLTVRNVGKALPTTLQNRIFHEGSRASLKDNKLAGMGLGLALCQKIVELHGGHLSTSNPTDDSVEFAIELPTGAPFNETAQLDLLQAQRYAQDIAQLMQRSRKTTPA